MEIIHVQVRDSRTVAKKTLVTSAGLTSGYQRTSNTTLSASAVATTGGDILVELVSLPWHSPLPSNELNVDLTEHFARLFEQLEEGYKAMATENALLAEESLPVALETWPAWED
jgi:hypothetical protein